LSRNNDNGNNVSKNITTANLKSNCIIHCMFILYTLSGNGAVYVRWGRMTCPNVSTELVYTGFNFTSNRN